METFNYEKALANSRTISPGINRTTGEVVFGGDDSRGLHVGTYLIVAEAAG